MDATVIIIYLHSRVMVKSIFGIPGIGPKKEQALVDAGYYSLGDLKAADFYEVVKVPGFGMKTVHEMWNYLGLEIKYPGMYRVEVPMTEPVVIENKSIKTWRTHKKTEDIILEPDEDKVERTTVWSFPKRGEWATHTAQYRGNWPPQVVRNLIKLYSKPGDTILDPMVGGGTTPVECKLLGRNSISVDINPGAAAITLDRLDFNVPDDCTHHDVYTGDARNLDLIGEGMVDMIATHPPYANIIHYAPLVHGDISEYSDYFTFFSEFRKAIREMYRVIKPGGYCAIMVGDTHSSSHFVPISTHMMLDFLSCGFILKEDIIKREWNCESDRYLSKYAGAEFMLTMHEHIFVFVKPDGKNKCQSSSIGFFSDIDLG